MTDIEYQSFERFPIENDDHMLELLDNILRNRKIAKRLLELQDGKHART